LTKQTQSENNPNIANQPQKRSQQPLHKVMEGIDQLKLDKLRSFQRIVRSKNAVLLKSRSQHHC